MSSAGSASFALYLHVPFCRSRCRYCDFYSVSGAGKDFLRRTASRLAEETEKRLERLPAAAFRTLFIGGGTPTLLHPDLLYDLVSRIRSLLPGVVETTAEANPESLDRARKTSAPSDQAT